MLALSKTTLALGWRHAVGDALRDARGALAVLMLCPPAERYSTAPPLFRLRLSQRVAYFEVRAHDADRCTRGRWNTLDKAPRGVGIAHLCRVWARMAAEFVAKRDAYRWADDASRDPNRCATAPLAMNAPTPRASGGSRSAKGPKGRASHEATFAFAPATGKGCATHAPTDCPTCAGSGKVGR